jgi:ribonuclease HII
MRDPAARLAELTAADRTMWDAGLRFAGIDEAGRGPLCGPVVAACVVMPPEPLVLRVDDSKRCAAALREKLFARIAEIAVFVGVGEADVAEIDELNILGATLLAMRRAAAGAPCDVFWVDGDRDPGLPGETRLLVRGDGLSYSVAAASIVAKVTRDRAMLALDARYPGYGIARHKGYGTAEHIAAIRALGPSPIHRRAVLRRITADLDSRAAKPVDAWREGARGEARAAAWLVARGMELLAQNLRGPHGEVDLVMRDGAYTVFVEVKRRAAGTRRGTGREAVNAAKQRRVCAVALRYLLDRGLAGMPVRFDVVELSGDQVTHLPNAFPYTPPARGRRGFL